MHVGDWWFYVADDAFISLRYADRLLSGDGLTWTDGPPVEGYSNLLYVVLTAIVGLFGLDLLWAARLVGLVGAVGATAAVAWPVARHHWAGGWVAGLGVAASTSVALWVPGGLEQPLVALWLALALAGLGRALAHDGLKAGLMVWPGIALALMCWTRPDSPLLVAALTLGWFLAAGQDRKALTTSAVLAGIPALATLAQVAVRLAYYGDWVPNTAHVKLRPSEAHTDMGALWTAQALDNHLPLVLLAALAIVGTLPGEAARARVRIALPVLFAWLSYTVWIGGDIFPAFRHFVPMVVMLAWLAGGGVAGMALRWRWAGPTLAVLATAGLGWMTLDQRTHPVVARAHNEQWVLLAADVGQVLGENFSHQQPLVAVSPAGAIPYASRLPALDMIGLNDPHIGRTETVGSGWLGHETGDGDYVFEQQPDIIFFTGPKGGARPTFASEKQLAARSDFAQDYALVRWQTAPRRVQEPTEFAPWVRRSGVLGPTVSSESARVPVWLLTEHAGVLDCSDDGRFRLVLGAGDAVGGSIALPHGRWVPTEPTGVDVDLQPDGDLWRVTVTATQPVTFRQLILRPAP